MDREFSIYLDSSHSTAIYPGNKPANFSILLPRAVHLEGDWECALVQFVIDGRSEAGFYVCTDVVAESYVGDFMLPVLRRVRDRMWQFKRLIYVPVKTRDFTTICVYLRKWNNLEPTSLSGHAHCMLHFRRVT